MRGSGAVPVRSMSHIAADAAKVSRKPDGFALQGDRDLMTMSTCPVSVSIQSEPFDTAAEIARLSAGIEAAAGAVVTFSGLCRDENGRLTGLELEHYPGMAEEEIGRTAEEAARRWPILALRVVHRHGLVTPGEGIVLVAAASAHRAAAFEAASFLMDYLKTRAPFWKREHLAGGGLGGWVAAAEADDAAASRWA